MTPLSREILENYQTRRSKKQKEAFITLLSQHFPYLHIQNFRFLKCNNIIIGDVKNAKVIISAHYDTCTQLPFPNIVIPKNPILSVLYGFLWIIPILVLICLTNFAIGALIKDPHLLGLLNPFLYCALVLLLFAGPANKHNANDNTSGVIALCELIQILNPEARNNAAFIFFDQEENGLIGSSLFRKEYKNIIEDKLLINLDCISDGDYILVSASKTARKAYGDLLKQVFRPTDDKSILFANAERTYYPSDQVGFKNSVVIAALKKNRFLDYYLDKIHTKNDTVFDQTNIKLICDSVHRLLTNIDN